MLHLSDYSDRREKRKGDRVLLLEVPTALSVYRYSLVRLFLSTAVSLFGCF
jgi:hypothetical protein